jgi:hypothetical protein
VTIGIALDEAYRVNMLVDDGQYLAGGRKQRLVDLGGKGSNLLPIERNREHRQDRAKHRKVPGGEYQPNGPASPFRHRGARLAGDSRLARGTMIAAYQWNLSSYEFRSAVNLL